MKRTVFRGALAGIFALGAVSMGACKNDERQIGAIGQTTGGTATTANPALTGSGAPLPGTTGTAVPGAMGAAQGEPNSPHGAQAQQAGTPGQGMQGVQPGGSAVGAGTAAAAAAAAAGVDRMGAQAAAGTPMPMRDEKEVLRQLHHSNQMEIQMGKLAQQKGQSRAVKEYGGMLIRDHQMADKRVLAFAKQRSLTIGTEQPAHTSDMESKEKMDRVRALNGAEFDREFVTMMIADHERTVQLVKSARDDVEGKEIKALLDELLPKLEQHRERAQALATEGGRAAGPADEAPGAAQGRRPPRQ